ncbi:MAG: YidC/Oxa1 family insertase periplasmic-domain containing protein [Candidatus Fermentibacter sp.]|nr:YidC/Oxa1 family insertase periplasmic-domain containing protein [Candidatus Fermentibacter sp.]
MSDQQRLLLAAVLMSLVLVAGWMLGSSRRQAPVAPELPDPVPTSQTIETVEDSIPDSTSAQTPGDSSAARIDVPTERLVNVSIPDGHGGILVDAVLSTNGGAVVSWVMPSWRNLTDGADGPIELVNEPWFEALGPAGPVGFECGCPAAVVASGDVEITMTAEGGRERTYTFHPGSYVFEITDTGADAFTVAQGAIPVTETVTDPSRYFSAAWFAEKSRSKKPGSLDEELALGRVLWAAARSRYFTVLMMPCDGSRRDGYAFSSDPVQSPRVTLEGGDIRVYAGPVDYGRLHALGSRTDNLVDFGWPIIRWIGKLIYLFLTTVLSFASNWGVRIVILSVVMKLALMPLSIHSSRSMKRMQSMQPLVIELQKKYANDPMRQRQELSKLYKENGVNPLGGCLPLILQMPIFFALYRVLENSVNLRGAGFVLWITDLSRPEILIPFGTSVLGMPGIGLLPVLMGAAMFYQQKTSMTDPSQKSMAYIMPVMMTWFFMKFPAGLSLYWFVNNILSIAEQKLVPKAKAAPAVQAVERRAK